MKPPSIDFETLNLRDALDLAVLIEEEARDRYVELAGQLRIHASAAAAAFFETMARAEEVHRGLLLARRTSLFGDAPVVIRREQFSEIATVELDDVRVKMTRQEALEEALGAEEKAREFFERLITRVTNRDVGRLFAELRDEELEHRQLVLSQMSVPASATRRRARKSHPAIG